MQQKYAYKRIQVSFSLLQKNIEEEFLTVVCFLTALNTAKQSAESM